MLKKKGYEEAAGMMKKSMKPAMPQQAPAQPQAAAPAQPKPMNQQTKPNPMAYKQAMARRMGR